MKKLNKVVLAACAVAGLGSLLPAMAKDFEPAVVYGVGGKFDKGFNEATYAGAERFKKETGIAYREAEAANEAQVEQLLRNLARRSPDVIATVGFSLATPVAKVAAEFPKVRFTIADGLADGAYVQAISYKEQEGSFLVGMAAAMASKSGKIGFVGGVDAPTIRTFACGYLQGARYVNPKIELIQNMIGTTGAAFRDPTRAAELATSQFDRGVDVVFAAAGASGLGVLQAAADKGKLSIGVDSNQNHLHPGSVLTSMLKRIDVTVYDTFMQAKNGTWKAGKTTVGLKEEAVGWALDENNRKLITPEMESKINAAKADIISGKIQVVDYRDNNSCPAR